MLFFISHSFQTIFSLRKEQGQNQHSDHERNPNLVDGDVGIGHGTWGVGMESFEVVGHHRDEDRDGQNRANLPNDA